MKSKREQITCSATSMCMHMHACVCVYGLDLSRTIFSEPSSNNRADCCITYTLNPEIFRMIFCLRHMYIYVYAYTALFNCKVEVIWSCDSNARSHEWMNELTGVLILITHMLRFFRPFFCFLTELILCGKRKVKLKNLFLVGLAGICFRSVTRLKTAPKIIRFCYSMHTLDLSIFH